MEKQNFNIKQYPKSKHGFQCLGPCYYPKTRILHPTTIEPITNFIHPFCPVEPWEEIDNDTGKTQRLSNDSCFNPTERENMSNAELELNILMPYIDFNAEQFIKIYYSIFSFEESIDWIDKNNHVPLETKMRIINSALKAFGKNIDIFDGRFTDFFIEFIKTKMIKQLYFKVADNIGFDKKTKEIFIVLSENNNLAKNSYCIERINYIIHTFLDKEDVTKFLVRYFKL